MTVNQDAQKLLDDAVVALLPEHRLIRGIAFGLLIVAPFWIAVALIVWRIA